MDREAALHFGVGLAAFSVGIMGVAVNWLSAGLLAFLDILLFAVVYTIWLKPNDAAKYRYWRCCRRISAGHWMGRRHR